MQDFASLIGVVDKTANTVVLTWNLHNLPAVNSTTIVSVAVQRSLFGYNQWVTLATNLGSDFSGSTYTDTLGTEGTYSYRLQVVVGVAPHTTTLSSNVISAGTYTVSTLSGAVSGNAVTLSWTVGFGEIVSSTVQRSADGGTTWFSIRTIPGVQATDFSELLSTSGSFSYRVLLSIEDPETPDAIGKDTVITSNTVTFSVVGTPQD